MTKSELIENLEPFTTVPELGATVYFIMQSEEDPIAKRVDIDASTQLDIRGQFIESIRKLVIDSTDLSVLNLSSADDRVNAIYMHDLEEEPSGLEVIDNIFQNDDLIDFSFADDKLSSVRAIVILIGNDERQIAIYKQNYPVSLLKQDSVLSLIKSDTRFVRLESDVLKINDKIDLFKVGGSLYIINLSVLEKFYGFHEIIKRKASDGLSLIRVSDLIDNTDLIEGHLSEISFARKLVKATTDSPVLSDGIPNSEVISFTKNHPALTGTFQYSSDETRIHLKSKRSVNLFLKLLNDDYLISELTNRMYNSEAKDEVKIE